MSQTFQIHLECHTLTRNWSTQFIEIFDRKFFTAALNNHLPQNNPFLIEPYSNFCKEQKGYDPNGWFSGITFFSGLALWSFQIKTRSLVGCLFLDADFSTFFSFWPIKSANLQNPGFQSKIWTRWNLHNYIL